MLGADLEFLVSRKVGMQIGVGYIGFGAGINYHFKPSIRSSFLSLQYWNQGVGDSFAQNAVSANFVFRARKVFTCQLGLGYPISSGPAMPDDYVMPPVMLTYAIGVYFPI